MRLHRITLRDVRGVRERTVELPEHGIVVIEGPNEVGKTTLLEAFDLLLSTKATSKAAGVRALQPVGRDVGPFIEAELTVGGTRLRYAKQWLRQPSTTLHVLSPAPEQLTGDAAQQRVDGLLRTHLDRTLWDALRMAQSADGELAPLVSSAVLTQALDAAAGAHQHAEGADDLLDRVATEHALYFTATGRPTGAYRAALTRHTDAQDAVAEAHRRVEEGQALLERRRLARERVGEAEAESTRSAQRLAEADRAGAEAEVVAARHESALERLSHGRDRHRSAVAGQRRRAEAVAERDALSADLARAEAARQADLESAEGHRTALLAAEDAVARAEEGMDRATDALDAARLDADVVEEARTLAMREALLERAGELVAAVRAARDGLPERPVEREQALRVRALQDRWDAMRMQHAAGSPTLQVEALDSSVEVDLADEGGRASVLPGESERVCVAHDTTIEIPGRARLRIQLHQEALGRVAEINRVRRELDRELVDLGCASVEEVEQEAAGAERAHVALREATRDVEALLRPWGSALAAEAVGGVLPSRLSDEVDERRRRLEDSRSERPETAEPLPADEAEARAGVDRAHAALRSARARARQAAADLTATQRQVGALTTRLDRAEGHLEAQAARLEAAEAQLAEARRRVSDDALAAEVAGRAADVADLQRVADSAAAAVAGADVAGVRAALVAARREHARAARSRDEAHAELHHVSGQVELVAGEGRHELYDLAVADLEHAERELQAIDRRARAARHLLGTLTRHREAAHRAYVRPYTQALEDLGRRVYGEDFAVTVDEQLSLTARTLQGTTVPFADLSGGAKEQLGILARLAVARLVDPAQGVPVVIDDALGYSDPERLEQMGHVLGAAAAGGAGHGAVMGSEAGDVQVILLTCTPERYAAIPGAQTVRLTA